MYISSGEYFKPLNVYGFRFQVSGFRLNISVSEVGSASVPTVTRFAITRNWRASGFWRDPTRSDRAVYLTFSLTPETRHLTPKIQPRIINCLRDSILVCYRSPCIALLLNNFLQCLRPLPLDDMNPWNILIQRLEGRFHFGHHAAFDDAIGNQLLSFCD